ncbi:sensor histidine kinase [Paraburkholderia kururiensis]|uniref:histidine kinase n=1 Tax=Paraburkholderia kururiensis TaxID=984307 RepID=A0ABZ0WR27_9BURK|nr:ATP-binding protein [Paraburkholderia kururiensis]WQD79859.1 ATP-binding protein [Paraburkholderia kururiensis]
MIADASLVGDACPATGKTPVAVPFREVLLACLTELLSDSGQATALQVLACGLRNVLPGSRIELAGNGADGRESMDEASVCCTQGTRCQFTKAARAPAEWCPDCSPSSGFMRAVRKLADVVLVLDVPAPVEPAVLEDIDRVVNMVDRALELAAGRAAGPAGRGVGETEALTRELHDSVAQQLGFLSLLVARLPQQGLRNDPLLAEIRAMTTRLQRQVRELITSARLTLDGRSLQQALADSIVEFSRRCGVVLELDNRLPHLRLEPGVELHIVQIVREALSNVVRHAQADHAWVVLRDGEGGFHVSVMDDGVGLGCASVGENHYGLTILQERAQAIGATLELGSGANGGTCVSLFVPGNLSAKELR